jgi:hypothetical protein
MFSLLLFIRKETTTNGERGQGPRRLLRQPSGPGEIDRTESGRELMMGDHYRSLGPAPALENHSEPQTTA